jgi:hypothetical protein
MARKNAVGNEKKKRGFMENQWMKQMGGNEGSISLAKQEAARHQKIPS